jgi:hypothetical protein
MLTCSIIAGLSRNLEENSYLVSAKYAFMLLFVTALIIERRRLSGDRLAMLGYYFFLFFSILFTLISGPDAHALFAIAGYFLCFLIYLIGSSDSGDLLKIIEKSTMAAAIVFAALNVFFVFDPNSYSLVKGQFSGLLDNANAFAGLAGLFFVFLVACGLKEDRKSKRVGVAMLVALYGFYILIAGSRGVLLAIAAALIFLDVRSIVRVSAIATMFLLGVVLALNAGFTQIELGGFAQRDIFEQSGRGELLDLYIAEIFGRSLVGTGLGEASGRIKSELSYLDIVLFSGIGALGFAVFLGRTFLIAAKLTFKYREGGWIVVVFAYVVVASIFEGYAANVMSLPTLLLYLVSGLIYASSKRKVRWLL